MSDENQGVPLKEGAVEEKSKNLFETIFKKGIEALNKPFVVRKVKRSFASAYDSAEEKSLNAEASLNNLRERLVESGKSDDGNLGSAINAIVDAQKLVAEGKEIMGIVRNEYRSLFGEDLKV